MLTSNYDFDRLFFIIKYRVSGCKCMNKINNMVLCNKCINFPI